MRKGATRKKMAESEVEYVETYYLNRGDKEYQVSMNTPVSAEMISRMFNVERSSVWLRDYITSRVYLPDEEGCFAGFRPTILSRILVEGRDCEGTQSSSMGITAQGHLVLAHVAAIAAAAVEIALGLGLGRSFLDLEDLASKSLPIFSKS